MLKNNLNFRLLVFLFTIIVCLAACKKEVPFTYTGENFLYFINEYEMFVVPGVYKSERKFSFLDYPFHMDTVETNAVYNGLSFPLSVQTDGRLANVSRKISIMVEGDGKEFAIFPHPDSMYIPANGIEYILNIKIIRPPIADTAMKTLTIHLKNNEDFSPEKHEWKTITYKFGNSMTATDSYTSLEEKYGEFSTAKMFALQYAVDRAGAAFWDADVILLNDFLVPRRVVMRKLSFNPFTLAELCYFMQLNSYVIYNFFGSDFDQEGFLEHYDIVANKMISLAKDYISERKAAGDPILDEKGKEIFFP